MPFSQYTTLEKAQKAFQISFRLEPFVVSAAVEISAVLRDEIDFAQKFVFSRTESGRRENLIYPFLTGCLCWSGLIRSRRVRELS